MASPLQVLVGCAATTLEKVKRTLSSKTLRHSLSILLRPVKLYSASSLNGAFGKSIRKALNHLNVGHLAITTEHTAQHHCPFHPLGTSLLCIGWLYNFLYLRAPGNFFDLVDRTIASFCFLLLCKASFRLDNRNC